MTDEDEKLYQHLNLLIAEKDNRFERHVYLEGTIHRDGSYTVNIDDKNFPPWPKGANIFAVGGPLHRKYLDGESATEAIASGLYVNTMMVYPGKSSKNGKLVIYSLYVEKVLWSLVEKVNPLCEEEVSPWLGSPWRKIS